MLDQYRQLSRNTLTIAGTIGLVLIAHFAWSPLLPLYLRDLGGSESEIGIAFSVFTLANAVPALFGGMLADRLGRKWVIIVPGVALGPLYLFAALAREWWLAAGLMALTFFLGAVQWPAMQALVSESDQEQPARAFAALEVFVLGAAIAGPLLGSVVLDRIGVSGLLVLNGLAMIPATLLRARFLRETHHARHRVAFDLAGLRKALTPQALWITAANALFMLAIGLSVEGPFGSLLASDVWKIDEQHIQWIWAVGAAVALLGVWLGGKADQWGERRVWALAAMGMAVSLVGWGLSARWESGTGFVFGAFVFFETVFIVGETLLAHHTTPASRSWLFGFATRVGGFATAAGPVLGAWLQAQATLAAPFVAGAVAASLSVGLLVFVRDVPRG